MAGDNDLTAAFLKQFSEVENTNIDPESVEFDEESLRLWLRIKEACNHFGIDFEEVREENPNIQQLEERARNLGVNKAVQEDDITRMSAIKGVDRDDAINMSDWDKMERVRDLWRQEPKVEDDFTNSIFQAVIFSSQIPPTGRGKTNTGYSFIEGMQDEYPGLRVLTNNTSDPFETVPEHWDDLEQLIRDDDEWKVLFIDEAAQFLQYADQSSGKTVSQMLKLLRHNYCHLIMVGHTGKDIPADIRRQVFFCDKQSQTKAVIGYGIEQGDTGNTMQVAEELMTLRSIPETNVRYDDIDDEGIEIKFGDRDEDEQSEEEIIEDLKENTCLECSNPTYENFPYCYSHLRKAISEGEYGDIDLEKDDEDNAEENQGGYDECRVNSCGTQIGIGPDGFCSRHGIEDLE